MPAFSDGGARISSGAVRAALAAGEVEAAAALLGYPWFVSGDVVHGDKRGRELGFPTANLRLDPACGLKHGIYAVRVGLDGRRCDGVASFGRRPMFDNGAVLLEVFLFDFQGDIYGRTLDVAFIDWIRAELMFASVDDLVRRMDEDCGPRRPRRAPPAFPPMARWRSRRPFRVIASECEAISAASRASANTTVLASLSARRRQFTDSLPPAGRSARKPP